MNTYTPTQGLTPAGTQLASGAPNATNSVPPPNSPSEAYGSWQGLGNQYVADNATMTTATSPDTRQALVNNSNIPAQQSNYDDLAKQLFEYDQAKLAPQFQGQNAGVPTDAASFGRVDASPLAMTVNSAGLPASQGLSIYNNNPKYAYTSQMEQGNSILNLLDTLNRAINSGMTDVKGKNTSNVQSAQAAIDQVYKLMELKQSAEDKATARSNASGPGTTNDAMSHAQSDAAKGVTFTDLVQTYGGKLDFWTLRDIYNNAGYYKDKNGKPIPETESLDDIINMAGKPKGAIKPSGKNTTSTFTPITSTSKGQTTVTGWKLKLDNGSSKVIKRPATQAGVGGAIESLLGGNKDATAGKDPQQIYNEYKSAGATDQQIVDRMQKLGFTIQ